MARQRDYKAEYARRQARARSLGYGSYYERRVAGVPVGERARARGHRGRRDLVRSLGPGDLVILPEGVSSVQRDSQGRYVRVDVLVIDAETGRERTFTLRRVTPEQLSALLDRMEGAGAVWSPTPSLDLRRIIYY